MPETVQGYDSYDLWYGYMRNQHDHIKASLWDELDLAIRPGRQFEGPIIHYPISEGEFALRFKEKLGDQGYEFIAFRYSLGRSIDDIISETFDATEIVRELKAQGFGPTQSSAARVFRFSDRSSKLARDAVLIEKISSQTCPQILKNLKAIEKWRLPPIDIPGIGRNKKKSGSFQDGPWVTVQIPLMTGDSNNTILYVFRGDQKSESAALSRRLTEDLDECSSQTVSVD